MEVENPTEESKSTFETTVTSEPQPNEPTSAPVQQMNSLQGVFGGLNDFSMLLSGTLGGMDKSIVSLGQSFTQAMQLISAVKEHMDKQDKTIQLLEEESQEQREKLEKALQSVATMHQNVDSQLHESTKQLHKEMVIQRTSTKMDINSLKGKLSSSMSEALSMFQESPKFMMNGAQYNANGTTQESIDFLVEKVKNLEEAHGLQHSVNQALSSSISEGSGAMIQNVYDSLYEQINDLEDALQSSRNENAHMKNKYNATLKELKELTRNQSRQIEELTGAVLSKNKMKRFKLEIAKSNHSGHRASSISSYDSHQSHDTSGSGANTAVTGAEGGEDEKKDGEEGDLPYEKAPPRASRRSTSGNSVRRVSSNRASRFKKRDSTIEEKTGSDSEDEGDGKESSADTKERGEKGEHRESKVEKEVFRPTRQPSVRKSVVEPPRIRKTQVSNLASSEIPTDGANVSSPETRRKSHKKSQGSLPVVAELSIEDSGTGGSELKTKSSVINTAEFHSLEGVAEDAAELDPDEDENDGDEFDSQDGSYGDSYFDDMDSDEEEGVSSSKLTEIVQGLTADYETRIAELENSITTIKRITYCVDDLKINYDSMKKKFDEIMSVKDDSVDSKIIASKFKTLHELKTLWHKVLVEMLFGLENLNDDDHDKGSEHNSVTSGGNGSVSRDNRGFFNKAAELVSMLEMAMDDFEPRDTLPLTLVHLHPALDKIYKQALLLIKMDRAARQSDSLDFSFDDILCSDLTPNLKRYVEEATAATVFILDENIAKIGLQLRLDSLEDQVTKKADAHYVSDMNTDIRHMLKDKLSQQEFMQAANKLASLSEVQALRKQLNEGASGIGIHSSSNHSSGVTDGDHIRDLAANKDFQELQTRFEALTKLCSDVQLHCKQYVPREEVHEAMKAVIGEVKMIKKNFVPSAVFKEGLKMKADTEEMERLVKALQEAVGELNLNYEIHKKGGNTNNISINMNDVTGSAAAMHQKCLICDKPVSNNRAKTAGKTMRGSTAMQMSRSAAAIGYDKDMEHGSGNPQYKLGASNDSTMFNRLTSPNLAVSNSERAKVVSELAIIRSSIDPLPDISDSVSEYSPRNTNSHSNSNTTGNTSNYKQRIRSSAGGGAGPSYKMDTR